MFPRALVLSARAVCGGQLPSENPPLSGVSGPLADKVAFMSASDSTTDRRAATRALQHMARSDPTVDPKSVAQMEAYMALRKTSGRVSAAALHSHIGVERKAVQSAELVTTYWTVSKAAFPSGVPEELKAARVAPSLLRDAQLPGGTLDLDDYYIFDRIVPREKLGVGAMKVKFALGAKASYIFAAKDPESCGALPSSSGLGPATPLEGCSGAKAVVVFRPMQLADGVFWGPSMHGSCYAKAATGAAWSRRAATTGVRA